VASRFARDLITDDSGQRKWGALLVRLLPQAYRGTSVSRRARIRVISDCMLTSIAVRLSSGRIFKTIKGGSTAPTVGSHFGVRMRFQENQWLNECESARCCNPDGSKYPPAKPGALGCEPLIAAAGALTRPRFVMAA